MDIVLADEPKDRRKEIVPLSGQDLARAEELARGLVRGEDELDDIVTFGSDAQAAVTQISKDMLRGVRVGALDEVVRLSDHVLAEVHTLDMGDLLPSAQRLLGWIPETAAAIKRRIENFFKKFELVNTHLDRQEAGIIAEIAASTDRYNRAKALKKATLETLLDAHIKATAIKIFLDSQHGYTEAQRRLQAVDAEKKAAQAEERSMNYLTVASADRYGKYLERLETKAAALQQLMISAYQLHLTVGMMGENENVIRQRLNDIRTDLLPQWRLLIGTAWQNYQQRGIAEVVERLRVAEADLRRQSGDQIEKTSQEIAAMMKKSGIDIDAMRYYQEKLNNSLDTLKTASIEARKIRDQAEAEMQKLIGDMSAAAAGTVTRKE